MNQQTNNPADKMIEKEEANLAEMLKEDPFFSTMVRQILVDYVTNHLSYKILAEKYHISEALVKKISIKFKFDDKKREYDKKLLDNILGKAQKQQAAIIAKITLAINEQVNRLIKKQDEDPDFIISNNHMKDLISSLTIFSKEYRLDNNKMTESLGFNVRVEFPAHIPVITNNNKRIIDAEVQKEIDEVKDVVTESVKKESEDDVLFDPDDNEPSISNKSFFGMVE